MRLGRIGLLGVALACGIAAGPPPEGERFRPGGPPGWLVDPAGGCWVWVGGIEAGAEALTTSWNGPCPDGPAEGEGRSTVRWRAAGRDRSMEYEGAVRRGRNEGRGRIVHAEGGQPTVIEDGEFLDDRFVGGRFEVPRAGVVYEGGWRYGHPHGQGRVTIRGRVFEGDWRLGCLDLGDRWLAVTRPAGECEGRPT